MRWFRRHKSPHAQMLEMKLKRSKRVRELQIAYKLAKEELGEEPTIDQIFLTRDTLRKDTDGTS